MQKIISIIIIFALISASLSYGSTSNIVYALKLKYDGTRLSSLDTRLIEGTPPNRLNQPQDGFTLKVIASSNTVLYSYNFTIETTPANEAPRDIFDADGNQIKFPNASLQTNQETEFVIIVPYFENAKSIDIYDQTGKIALSVDVSQYSKSTSSSGIGLDSLLKSGAILAVGALGFLVILAIAVFLIFTYIKKKKENEKKAKDKGAEKDDENKCKKCGAALKRHAKFCKKCGQRVTTKHNEGICPECGSKNELDAKFCEKCGTKL